MTKQEFNKRVKAKVYELLNEDAERMYNLINTQHLYRIGGLIGLTLSEVLIEIAQADILGVDLVDSIDIEEEIKSM